MRMLGVSLVLVPLSLASLAACGSDSSSTASNGGSAGSAGSTSGGTANGGSSNAGGATVGGGGTSAGGGGGAQADQKPTATINHPGDGETRQVSAGQVPLVGVATDPQDGALTGTALAWTSSIDGALGTGAQLDVTLTAGTHSITLTATDSDGNTGTDSITLVMQ